MVGIYKIENKLNGKIYIGQSKNIEQRLSQHKTSLLNSNKSWYPQARRESNSLDDFEFSILQNCNLEELDELEEYWINYYNSWEQGYNKTTDGTINGEKPLYLNADITRIHYYYNLDKIPTVSIIVERATPLSTFPASRVNL